MTIPPTNRILLLLLFPLLSASLVHAETIPGLGTASFPTSTHSATAAHEFARGLLLLHLFEYDDAAASFIAAEKADPAFAMAYWGEAMTFNHPVWNEVDVQAGQAALAKFAPTQEARAQRIADPRERAWFSTVEILYSGAGSKPESNLSSVDLPQPDGPSTAMNSPSSRSKLSGPRASSGPRLV